jgi:hypothetical protein
MSLMDRLRPRTIADDIRDHSEIIIGIDPGTLESGVVLIAEDSKSVIARGVCENKQLVRALYLSVRNEIVIERIVSYGMAVGESTFETCVWTGRFIEAVSGSNFIYRVPRQEVGLHLCRSVKAKDANISQALRDKLGEVGTKKRPGPLYGFATHMWSALAVAITFIETEDRSKWEY